MAIGARTDNSADMMKKLLGEISNIMTTPDAPIDFLQQLHQGIVSKLREPVDMGYANGMLGPGGGQPGAAGAAGAMGGMGGMGGGMPSPGALMPGPSSAGGSPLAALLGGGGPQAAGGLMTRPSQPSADELRRVLRKVS